MIVIRSKLLPFGNYDAVNICGLLFVHPGVRLSASLLNHERIHTAQMLELCVIGFYIAYAVEWLARLPACGFKAGRVYKSLSFEREAYARQGDMNYLHHRRRWAMWRDLANS